MQIALGRGENQVFEEFSNSKTGITININRHRAYNPNRSVHKDHMSNHQLDDVKKCVDHSLFEGAGKHDQGYLSSIDTILQLIFNEGCSNALKLLSKEFASLVR